MRAWLPGPVALFCLALALPPLALHTMLTHDLWWHLAQGEHTLREGALPAVETFSWTAAGAPLSVNYSWLTDVVFAGLERASGLGLVEVLGFALLAATFRLVHAFARSLGAASSLSCAAVLVFALSSSRLLILRPQLFTYLGFALLLWLHAEHRRTGTRAILAAPLVVLVWANLHGGFLLGVAFLLGAALLEALEARLGDDPAAAGRARLLLKLGLAAALASCVNPGGPGNTLDALDNSLREPLAVYVDEWRPPDLALTPLLGTVAVAAVGLALVVPRRPPLFEAAGLLAALWLALHTWRHVPLFGVVGAPVLAAWATRALAAHGERLAPRARVALAVEGALRRFDGEPGAWLLIGVAALALGAREVARPTDVLATDFARSRYPVAAAAWVEAHDVRGRLFNSYRWGGFLVRALGPERKVFIDSRMSPYRPIFDDYATIMGGLPGWRELLAKHRVDWALLETNARLLPLLQLDPEWRRVHADETAEVFVRRGGPNEHLAPWPDVRPGR